MERLSARLLPFAVADGPHNMAADEVLLEAAVHGVASLRFYGWSPATLSLGYFQPAACRQVDVNLASLPFVRRPSGGMTLIHDRELTYALAIPAGPPWQTSASRGADWPATMHRIIAQALRSLGVLADLADSDASPDPGPLCFRHITGDDLLIDNQKIVGSAQRRQREALLQHGAILLEASPHAKILPGIRELSGRIVPPAALQQAIARSFTQETGWELTAGAWTAAERRRRDDLVRTRYTQASWNEKR